VSDPKWRFSKEDESWHSMGTTDIPLDALRDQSDQIAKLIDRIHALIKEIKEKLFKKYDDPETPNQTLQPHSGKA
jgi:hypothetical protein